MALLSDTIEPIRLLLLGNSGAGKTGSLVSLAEAGYTVHILDCDHKAGGLIRSLVDSKEVLSRFDVEVIQEPLTYSRESKKVKLKSSPVAFQNSMKILDSWRSENFGLDHVVVVDSLTSLSRYAGNVVAHTNKHDYPIFTDYGAVFGILRPVIDMLTAYNPDAEDPLDQFNCHVIVLAHINYYEVKTKTGTKTRIGNAMVDDTITIDTVVYPKAIGQGLSPEIPTYFNDMLYVALRSGERRSIYTVPEGLVPVKSPLKKDLAKTLAVSTGLAQYFKAAGFSLPL